MKSHALLFGWIAGFCLSSILGLGSTQTLPSKYQAWLADVAYISTPLEREVFQKLGSEEDRDRFIEEFWRQRDPTPGTPRNEFKNEHYRRLDFADKTFGRGTPFPGRRTERGRIYILLGSPTEVEKFVSSDTYPIEVWSYLGSPALGQSSYFRLMFYQKMGSGDYVLFNPSLNSPKELVGNPRRTDVQAPATDRDQYPQEWDEWDAGAYQVLRQLSPVTQQAVMSIIPGNTSPLARPTSGVLLAEIQGYPQKKVKDDYAKAILEHRPVVEVSYSAKFIGNRTAIAVAEESSGASALHYVIVPDRISFDSFGDQYLAALKVSIRIADPRGKTLYQQEKTHSLELHKEELKKISADSFQLYDSVPLIPGKWTVSLLLENTVSREFTSVEKDVDVPQAGTIGMTPLVLSRKVYSGPAPTAGKRAYQFGSLQLYPTVNNVFRQYDRIYVFFQVLGAPDALKDRTFVESALLRNGQTVWSIRKAVKDYPDPRFILEEIPPERVTAGDATVVTVLKDENGSRIMAAETPLRIVKEELPVIWAVALSNPPADDPFYDFVRGTQHMNAGEKEKGAGELALANKRRPDSVEFAVGYAQSLLADKNPILARDVLLPLLDSPDARFEFFATLGKAAKDSANYAGAVTWFGKSLSFRGNIVESLNAMGECYLELGEKDLAAESFKKSLAINPNQERIKELIKKTG